MHSTARNLRHLALDAGRLPLVGGLLSDAYRSYFNKLHGSNVRIFQGIFPDFASAAAAVPAGWRSGYDNDSSARRVIDEWLGVYPNDYPVMFWLSRLIPTSTLLFDWGGNVGLKYFAFRRYLSYPDSMTWLVNDVPAVVKFGTERALRESAPHLRFTLDLEEIGDADILLAAGVLHFLEDPYGTLRSFSTMPEHVILSKVPAYAERSAWTLHNMGTAMCPYHLFNRDELVDTIVGLGYDLIDEWKFPDVSCSIPFFPDNSIGAYSGFYFRQRHDELQRSDAR
jgi:putative methyltransferase (TIGR04325 family)